MGRVLTVAHHTVREAMRMKVVVAFALLILAMVIFMPVTIKRPDSTVTSMVQTFLSWSLMPLGVILSFLAIFLGCQSISDEMYHRQIFMLASKPLPRWQYVVGKWVGVVEVLTALLIFGGLAIYGMARLLAAQEPVDGVDAYSLENEVLAARAHSSLYVPDFTADAERFYQQMVEDGRYAPDARVQASKVKSQLVTGMKQRWRAVSPREDRTFEFRTLQAVDRSPDNTLQLRYKAKGLGYAQDETLQMAWQFGNPRDAEVFSVFRRDVMDRHHVIPFPAACVSSDGTLRIRVQNVEHDRPDHQGATISFEANEGFQVLYEVGTFHGNLMRTLFLMWCRIALLAGAAVLAATLVSYPVACLAVFAFYVLSVSGAYVTDALGFGGSASGLFGSAKPAVKSVLNAVFWLMPDFSRYDGIPNFVDGRNVTLMWDLQALGKLVLFLTTLLLMIACLIFRRRQVAELSI